MVARGTKQWQIPDYSLPVVLSSEYRSVEDFCNRIHRTLFKSFKTCASIAYHVGYRAGWDTGPSTGGDTVPRNDAARSERRSVCFVRAATMHAQTWSGDSRRGVGATEPTQ